MPMEGLGFWVSNDFEYEVVDELSIFQPHFFESLFIKIKTSKNKFSLIGNIYRPNTGPLADVNKFVDTLSNLLESIKIDPIYKNCEDFQLVGDYNLDLLAYSRFPSATKYVDELLTHGILPLITRPTRIIHRAATILDHISTSFKCDCYKAGILLSDLSDHFPVFYIREMSDSKKIEKSFTVRKINPANKETFKNLLHSIQWDSVTQENRPLHAFTNFF